VSPTFRSLAHPNYRRLAAGTFVSNIGTWMQRVAQDWLVLQLTDNSGAALGIATGLQFVPFLLFAPVAGVVADRIPKRRLLQLTNAAMAIPALTLGLLAVMGAAWVEAVYLVSFALGTAAAFDAPARQAFVSEVVGRDDLTNAIGLNSASFNLARVIGPAVAGLLIAGLGGGIAATGWVVLVNAVSYLAPILALRGMNQSLLRPAAAAAGRAGTVRAAIRYVGARPDLVLVFAIVLVTGTFGLNFQLTSALMTTEVFHLGPAAYGLLGATMAAGSVAGALFAARHGSSRLTLIVGAALAFGIVEIVAGFAPSYLAYATVVPLLGFSGLTLITGANSYVQTQTAPSMRGRVSGLYLLVFIGGTPFGSPLVGWIGEVWGPRWTLWFGGVMTVGGALVAAAVFAAASRGGPSRPGDTREATPVVWPP
jgi:MFS family permease